MKFKSININDVITSPLNICKKRVELIFQKNSEVMKNLTDFAIISFISIMTHTTVAVNSITTVSSVLTRIWVTVIFVYNNISEYQEIFNRLTSKKLLILIVWSITLWMLTRKRYTRCFNKVSIILKITYFTIISIVSRNTITSVPINSILTNSSVLTRIWVTVILIYNNIIECTIMLNKLCT